MELTNSKNYSVLKLNKANQQVLIISVSGGGKTIASETIAEKLHDDGYLIINISDIKKKWECAMCMFNPKEHYHLSQLTRQLDDYGKEDLPEAKKVILYHPFTFDLPTYKYPALNIFTFSLKNINREDCQFIFETPSDTKNVRLLLEGIDSLGNTDGYYDLIKKMKRMSGKSKKDDLDMGSGATGKEFKDVVDYMKRFQKHYFFMPNNFKLNINWRKLLADQEHYHIFSNKFIDDEKVRYFVTYHLLNELMDNLDHTKHPICLLIEEVRTLTPEYSRGYKEVMAMKIRDHLSTIRNKGRGVTTLMTSQVYYDVASQVRSSATKMLLGRMEDWNELFRMGKALRLDKETMMEIRGLKRGEFLLSGSEDNGAIKINMPRHCHAEEGYIFEEIYKRDYPEKMIEFSSLIKEIKEIKKRNEEEVNKVFVKERQETMKEDKKVKEAKESKPKKELKELKEGIKEEKHDKKLERNKFVIGLYEKLLAETGKEPSMRFIAKEAKCSVNTVIKIIKDWKAGKIKF